ncbi:MAG: hypothetical protein AAF805_00060 [Planctomycetota bacterium]
MPVEILGDVIPAPPEGFPNATLGPSNDANADGFYDWLRPEGNKVFTSGIVEADPDFPDGSGPFGVAWDHPDIWTDYDTNADTEAGRSSYGRLTVNGGADLRRKHLTLGRDEGGHGELVVTGPSSTYNADADIVPRFAATAINLATGVASPLSTDLPYASIPGSATVRRQPENGLRKYRVDVGLLGYGSVEVSGGGLLEVGLGLRTSLDALGPGSSVRVDAATLAVTGGTSSQRASSSIGVQSVATFTATNGAVCRFGGGLGLGFSLGDTADATGNRYGDVTGVIRGATTKVLCLGTPDSGQKHASHSLILGGMSDASLLAGQTDTGQGGGTYEIGDGATVYSSNNADVGRSVAIAMDGGAVRSDGWLHNDGLIEGSGSLSANSLINSRQGVISVGEGETLRLGYSGAVSPYGATVRAAFGLSGSDSLIAGNAGKLVVDGGSLLVAQRIGSAVIDPYLNLRRVRFASGAVSASEPGTITLRSGRVSFASGLINDGLLEASGGATVVSGAVENRAARTYTEPDDEDPETTEATASEGGLMYFGPGADVTFTDLVTNSGVIAVAPGARVSFAGGYDQEGEGQIRAPEGCPNPIVFAANGRVLTINGDEGALVPLKGLS